MNYYVMVAVGDKTMERYLPKVAAIHIEDGIYLILNKNGDLIFSAPADSLVYLEAE